MPYFERNIIASRISRFSAICIEMSMAFFSLMPLTSESLSGSSSMTRNVSSPKALTILFARASPIPLMAPEPRYRCIETASSGIEMLWLFILNWRP